MYWSIFWSGCPWPSFHKNCMRFYFVLRVFFLFPFCCWKTDNLKLIPLNLGTFIDHFYKVDIRETWGISTNIITTSLPISFNNTPLWLSDSTATTTTFYYNCNYYNNHLLCARHCDTHFYNNFNHLVFIKTQCISSIVILILLFKTWLGNSSMFCR